MAKSAYMPKTASEARSLGLSKYQTDKPCKRGHLSPKYTAGQTCVACKREDGEAIKAKSLTDPALAERLRKYQRDSKRKARKTKEGRAAHVAANKRYISRHKGRVAGALRERRKTDPAFAMSCWMRSSLHKLLSRANKRKDAKSVALLGYDKAALKAHIEAQFTRGMSWSNRGEWHIDHIVPVAEMIRRGETDPSVVNALTNLRPMWAKDNIAKSDTVTHLL